MKSNLTTIFFISLFLLRTITFAQEAPQDQNLYFKGNLEDPNGSEICNPCVKNVVAAVNTLRNHGTTLGFNWGDNYPEVKGAGTKSHWQGIQRLPTMDAEFPYLVVSSSHGEQVLAQEPEFAAAAHFAVIEMASRPNTGSRLRSNRFKFGELTKFVEPDKNDRIVKAHMITPDFDHPGGMQTIGNYLLVGSDGNINHGRDVSQFTLWDMSTPESPRSAWENPRWELPKQNANSVGIVRLEDGRYLMLRALTDAKDLEFYVLNESLEDNPAEYFDEEPWDTWNYRELESELFDPDSLLDLNWSDLGHILGDVGYQSTNIITECETGLLYLIVSHGRRPQGTGGDDFVDLFRLDVPTDRPDPDGPAPGVVITKVAKRHMFPSGNADARQGDLQAGGGAYVSPDNKLYYYATEHGRTGNGGYVKMIEFAPQEPTDEVDFLNDAWIELYDDVNFSGRSIMLDYIDRQYRDYDDLANTEEFADKASSIIFAIPSGYELRLYCERFKRGGYIDLIGNGKVTRITDLSAVITSDGRNANNCMNSAQWNTSITYAEEHANVPAFFELYQNFPNPFNPETIINYQVNKEAEIKLVIYDIKGELIKTLVDGMHTQGFFSTKWGGTDELGNRVASGTYLYRLEMGEFVAVKKLTLLR